MRFAYPPYGSGLWRAPFFWTRRSGIWMQSRGCLHSLACRGWVIGGGGLGGEFYDFADAGVDFGGPAFAGKNAVMADAGLDVVAFEERAEI